MADNGPQTPDSQVSDAAAQETTGGKKTKQKKPFYKKWWFWLIVVIVVVVIAAAGSGGGDDDETDAAVDAGLSSLTATVEGADDADAETGIVDFEEITVVDNDEITITLTGLDPDNADGYTFDVTIVNKSSDVTYTVIADDANCSVDGLLISALYAEDVAPGKTSYSELIIEYADELVEAGVAFTDIALSFDVYDSDDWTDVVDGAVAHVYPYGEDAATTYVRESASDDEVLVDNDYVTVTLIGCDPDAKGGYAVELYITNKTDAEIYVSNDNVSINGIMCDPYWGVSMGANTSCFEEMTWYDSDLEDIGIEDAESEISDIEFTLEAWDLDTYEDCFEGLEVTLSVQD